mmetsp:Transcript_18688/g.32121  ORF Transcript_18688/g.32121 Transcript_18688/m.32121 type:complete len:227 (+) Transcript_18688:472-1152(+)
MEGRATILLLHAFASIARTERCLHAGRILDLAHALVGIAYGIVRGTKVLALYAGTFLTVLDAFASLVFTFGRLRAGNFHLARTPLAGAVAAEVTLAGHSITWDAKWSLDAGTLVDCAFLGLWAGFRNRIDGIAKDLIVVDSREVLEGLGAVIVAARGRGQEHVDHGDDRAHVVKTIVAFFHTAIEGQLPRRHIQEQRRKLLLGNVTKVSTAFLEELANTEFLGEGL